MDFIDNKPPLTRVQKAIESNPENRSLEEYLSYFNITTEDLGSTVLDLGSGYQERLAREAEKYGIQVFSVNPMLANEIERRIRDNSIHEDWSKVGMQDVNRTTIAIAQMLPFGDDTFDTVLSLYAVPLFLEENDQEYTKAISETYRVLKPDGKAYLGPISNQRIDLSKTVLESLGIPYSVVDKGVETRKFYEYDGSLQESTSHNVDVIIHKPPIK